MSLRCGGCLADAGHRGHCLLLRLWSAASRSRRRRNRDAVLRRGKVVTRHRGGSSGPWAGCGRRASSLSCSSAPITFGNPAGPRTLRTVGEPGEARNREERKNHSQTKNWNLRRLRPPTVSLSMRVSPRRAAFSSGMAEEPPPPPHPGGTGPAAAAVDRYAADGAAAAAAPAAAKPSGDGAAGAGEGGEDKPSAAPPSAAPPSAPSMTTAEQAEEWRLGRGDRTAAGGKW